MSLPLENQVVCNPAIKRSWTRTAYDPLQNSLRTTDETQYVMLKRSEPFEDMGDMMSSIGFWRQADKISDGWLCQDATGGISAAAVPEGTSLEATLGAVVRWSHTHNVEPRLVVLVSRKEATSSLVERRLHKMSAGLRTGRWTKVRLCVITRSDLLYIRNPPMKHNTPESKRSQQTDHESPT